MKKNKLILILVGLIGLILIIRLISQQRQASSQVEIMQIEPSENSQIYASEGKLEIMIYFNKKINQLTEEIEIKDNLGLNWIKEVKGENIISWRSEFGKELMAVENLMVELSVKGKLIKSWNYQIPIDEKIAGPMVEPKLEKNASFVPSDEDIEYFAKEDEIINQEQPLWRLLPYETDTYKISHYIEPLKLVIYLKTGADGKEVEKAVKQWIEENGGKEHKIEYRYN